MKAIGITTALPENVKCSVFSKSTEDCQKAMDEAKMIEPGTAFYFDSENTTDLFFKYPYAKMTS